ncbi:MAG: hypothetical protein M1817_003919 [Caeruleum heppii]|nr:MAG: hypothetical protein M1817_003919 [Caeruleum heppii]
MADAAALIGEAFGDEPALASSIKSALTQTPQYSALFDAIAHYVLSQKSIAASVKAENDRPPAKKRRIEESFARTPNDRTQETMDRTMTLVDSTSPPVLTVGDLSFSIPRKKLRLEFTKSGLRGRNPTSSAVECGVNWADVEHAVLVPLPEKANRQYNLCIFPYHADGLYSPPQEASVPDTIVFTIPDAAPRAADGPEMVEAAKVAGTTETHRSLMLWMFDRHLPRGKKVTEPDPDDFVSALGEAHRKDEKAVHVKAFRGSKEGYLFFLPTGILWAFKKPLLFFSFATIVSTSYTSVLQRTFNLNLTISSTSSATSESGDVTEWEFSMIDQADFPGIDAYIKSHDLQDASMAEVRRAKKVPAASIDPKGASPNDAEPRELAKAMAQMRSKKASNKLNDGEGKGEGGFQGEEDSEDEGEDYDPGSEGQSEGSGSSSEGEEEEEEAEGEGDEEEAVEEEQ